jgi:hypothetical protein
MIFQVEHDINATKEASETLDTSVKLFTVPVGEIWKIKSIWAELFTTAAAGNRQLEVTVLDTGLQVVATMVAGAVQAASLTRYYLFAPGLPDLAAFRDTSYLTTPLPELLIPAGYRIKVWDNKAVAAAADDLFVRMLVEEQER